MEYLIPKFRFVTLTKSHQVNPRINLLQRRIKNDSDWGLVGALQEMEEQSYLFLAPLGDILEKDPETGITKKLNADPESEPCSCCHCKNKSKSHFMRG